MPYIAGRVAAGWRRDGEQLGSRRFEQLRSRVFTDSVTPTPGALDLACRTYGTEHVLFATDYPWQPREPMFRYLDEHVLPAQKKQILGNGIRW